MTYKHLFYLLVIASVSLALLSIVRDETFPALVATAMAIASIANAFRAPNQKITVRDFINQFVPK